MHAWLSGTGSGPVVVVDEVQELNEQLSEREHRMHDLSALVKRLENEKQELQAAIEEADSALEQSETKLQLTLADQTELKAETERRVAEKESEFETTRYRDGTVVHCTRILTSHFHSFVVGI